MVIRSDNNSNDGELQHERTSNEEARRRGALGAMLIGTVALASAASADQVGDDTNVDVSVEIESNVEPGNLALTVAANSTTLTEADESSVEGTREFNGALPEVTVTDTRTEVPEGAYWYVLGSASAFTGDAGEIGADNLGWAPPSSTVATPAWSPRVSRSSRPSRTARVSSTRSSWSRRSTRPRSTRRVPGPPARTSRCARARTSRRARTTRPSRCPCSRTEPSRRPGDRSRPGTDRVVTRRVAPSRTTTVCGAATRRRTERSPA